jgi:CO dehydrogenase/acetyl-CoA synthase epsilon subunit
MKLGWAARVWKWGSFALLSVGLAVLIANRKLIVEALKSMFPGKGLWDYLEMLLVPVLIFGLTVLLERWNKNRDVVQRNESERIRQEEAKDQALQLYFDRISSILIDKQVISLAEAAKKLGPDYKDPLVESARDVIRAQTLAILRVFSADKEKKSSVVRFLIESEILSSLTVSLSGADLSGADLSGAHLAGANLTGADLSGDNLSYANLSGAKLFSANLSGAILSEAYLSGANLSFANLSEANFSRANEFAYGANLSDADLSWANLENIKWDEQTSWPDLSSFKGARNIPEALKKQLGL